MQIRKYVSILFLTILTIWHTSCTKHAVGIEGPAGATGPAGANGDAISPSAITGFIELYDQYGFQNSSNAGVILSAMKGDTIETATTDSIGKFILPPLPPGNYDIHVKKAGFDSLKVFVQHSAGNEPKFIGIVRLDASLTTKITNETLNIQSDVFGDKLLVVNVSFNGPPSTNQTLTNFNFYFSKSKNLSTQNYDAMTPGNNEATATNNYQLQYVLANITAAGINYSSGDTIYIKTYVSPAPGAATSWFDYTTYQTISYPYPGDSVVNHFLWP